MPCLHGLHINGKITVMQGKGSIARGVGSWVFSRRLCFKLKTKLSSKAFVLLSFVTLVDSAVSKLSDRGFFVEPPSTQQKDPVFLRLSFEDTRAEL